MKSALLVALVACSTPSTAPPANHVARKISALDRGLDFERGRGTARSYPAAVRVYRDACREGCGDLAVCDRLFALASGSRGILMDDIELIRLANRLCDRKDMNGCIAALMIGTREEATVDPYKSTEDAVDACDRGNLGACELVLFSTSFNFGGSSAIESRAQDAAEHACLLGELDGCAEAINHYRVSCSEPIEACVEKQARQAEEWKLPDAARVMRDVLRRTVTACHDGDADACKAVGRPLSPSALCDAGDYDVCVALAHTGDARAKQIACAAGADADCAVKVAGRSTRRGLIGTVPRLRELCTKDQVQPACDTVAKLTLVERCP